MADMSVIVRLLIEGRGVSPDLGRPAGGRRAWDVDGRLGHAGVPHLVLVSSGDPGAGPRRAA
jgi:hypothetical protein